MSTTTTLPLGDAGASAAPNGISLLLLLFFLVFTFYIFNIVLDLANLTPPEIEYPANGSSCSTGGLACGHAAGNVLNFGDVDQAAEDHILAQGHVDLTIVHQPPCTLTINESSVIKVRAPCHISMGPLLRHVAQSYSPMRKNNSHVYVLDKKQWDMLGRFEVATAEDGRCSWIVKEGEPKLHILVVS
ncbi:hypothetical protein CPB84DRAFT_1691010 [Gymnopilus junonius]|uniref:Uncharacterized protein n=1 Tax=Gymnopilus junonius TaxID=109634 RepID=A0A9P5NB46_GYMJU|nr:hypothetical protein CPB84DRAFT_1691010 [Gymnopilus junonius]